MHSFNFSGNKWSPEDEEMAILKDQELSEANFQQSYKTD